MRQRHISCKAAFTLVELLAVIGIIATHNTPAGFASSVTLTTFLMFAFGSKAFCNYYFFVLGALCVTLAAYPPVLVAVTGTLQLVVEMLPSAHT